MMSDTELQYGECCCCLEKGDHRELTKLYYLDKRPEIYEVLFKDTFNIAIKYPENTKLICDCCIVELRQASHFRFMVNSSQQHLGDRVTWESEFVDDTKDQLNTEIIKCDSDSHTEEADNDIQHSELTTEEVNNAKEIDIKEETLGLKEPPQQINTDFIKHESNNDMEGVHGAVQPNIQDNSEPSVNTVQVVFKRTASPPRLASSGYRYNCVLCQYKTQRSHDLIRHMRTHTGAKPTGPPTPSSDKLAVGQVHTAEIQYSCDKCKYKTIRKRYLTVHMRKHGEKPFSCDKCKYKTIKKKYLNKHMLNHTREKPLSCDKFQYKSAKISSLNERLRTHTEEKSFSCDKCQYKSPTKSRLNEHLLTHAVKMPYSCDQCQYKTVRRRTLIAHMRTHTAETPYSCETCQYQSVSKSSLNEHLRTHTGEMPYCCDKCQYKTVIKRDQTVHIHIHTGKSP